MDAGDSRPPEPEGAPARNGASAARPASGGAGGKPPRPRGKRAEPPRRGAVKPTAAGRLPTSSESYPAVDLSGVAIPAELLSLLPERVARAERILPVSVEGETVTVVRSRPPSPETYDRLRFLLNRPVAVALADEGAILEAIDRHYGPAAAPGSPGSSAVPGEIDFVEIDASEMRANLGPGIPDPDSPQVASLLQRLVAEAFQWGASQMLVLPVRERLKIAHRVGDAVYTREDPPPEMLYPLLARLMTMTSFDGGIKVFIGRQQRRLRARFRPTRHGLSALIDIDEDGAAVEACKARAARLGYPYVALEQTVIPAEVLAALPERLARENRALPVWFDGETLVVAVGDPQQPEMLDRLRFALNRPVAAVMAPGGAILAAIERYYGPPDPEAADLILWEFAHVEEAAVAAAAPAARHVPGGAVQIANALLAHLETLYRPAMFALFDDLAGRARLCARDPATGNLEVVFPQSHLMRLLPAGARRYLEDQIWLLREAILARLENYLERHPVARGIGITYALYLAARQWASGEAAAIDPGRLRDAWVNFVYAFTIRSFPHLESNGTLLGFLTDRLDELGRQLDALLDNADLVKQPDRTRAWLGRQFNQMSVDEAVDCESSPVTRLVELVLDEAVGIGASAVLILPWPRHVEVAFRVHHNAYAREDLPLRLLCPVLDRVAQLGGLSGEFRLALGGVERSLRATFSASAHGLAAVVEILPDAAALERARTQAAELGFALRRLDRVEASGGLLHLLPKAIAWRKMVLPISVQGGFITVALSDPPSARRLNELRLVLNNPITVVLAAEDDLRAAIYRHYHPEPSPAPSPTAAAMLLRGPAQPKT
jgi:type II secretory ATPase GspE/PulE/Tfp pilus assembly ATPase PilB-like protein